MVRMNDDNSRLSSAQIREKKAARANTEGYISTIQKENDFLTRELLKAREEITKLKARKKRKKGKKE